MLQVLTSLYQGGILSATNCTSTFKKRLGFLLVEMQDDCTQRGLIRGHYAFRAVDARMLS